MSEWPWDKVIAGRHPGDASAVRDVDMADEFAK